MSEQPYIYRYVDVEIAIATATQQERERIIKLLEGLQDTFADPQYSTTGGYAEIFALKQGITLIKDETKQITSEIMPDGLILIKEVKGKTE